MYDLIIIGGGIAGLSAAFYAHQKGLNFLLLESSNRLGGAIGTELLENRYVLESGPNSVSLGSTLTEIIEKLPIRSIEANKNAKNKFIYAKNKFFKANNPLEVLFGLLSGRSHQKIWSELFLKPYSHSLDESVYSFISRHFGEEVADNLVWPVLNGIYAGDPRKLSVKSVFPKLPEIENKYGSLIRGMLKERSFPKRRIFTFQKGLGQLVKELQFYIGNEAVKLNSQVSLVEETEHCFQIKLQCGEKLKASKLVLAVPAHAAAKLLPEALAELSKIHYASVCTTTFWVDSAKAKIEGGFGFLTARNTDTKLLGVIYGSSLFGNRAPEDKMSLTAFLGESTVKNKTEEELVEIFKTELTKVFALNEDAQLELKLAKNWEFGIPQYELGHTALIEKILMGCPVNLKLAGNYLKGVSLEDTAKSGKLAIEALV